MTRDDKKFLMDFVTRTGMCIFPVDLDSINNFLAGYECGRGGKCSFLRKCRELLAETYNIPFSSDGFRGQIMKLAERRQLPQVVAFKQIAIQTLAVGELDQQVGLSLTTRIIDLISKIEEAGHRWFNETWKEEWHSFAAVNEDWFQQLWDNNEVSLLTQIDSEVKAGNLFKDPQSKIPSDRILKLKQAFELTSSRIIR